MPQRTALLLAAAALVWVLPAAAGAHPFGPPPTARLAASGNMLRLTWTSAPDDAIAIGERLGLLPAGSTEAYRDGVTQVAPPADAEARLDRSEALHGYLRDRITVTQQGTRCPVRVEDTTDFVHSGARLVARCPQPIRAVEVSITMLTDIHDAYRTFATAEQAVPRQALYTLRTPSHVWRFGAAPAGRAPAVATAAGVLALLGVGGSWWWRRRRR